MALRNQYYEWTDELTNLGWFVILMGSIWFITRFNVYHAFEALLLALSGGILSTAVAVLWTGDVFGEELRAVGLGYGTGFVTIGLLTMPLGNEYLFLPLAVVGIIYAIVMGSSAAFRYQATGWTAGGILVGIITGALVVI